MARLTGKKRRKIKEPTDSMRKYYGDMFIRNQSKFMRRSKLEPSHLNLEFTFEKSEVELIGSLSPEECMIHVKAKDMYLVVHIDDVTKAILGD